MVATGAPMTYVTAIAGKLRREEADLLTCYFPKAGLLPPGLLVPRATGEQLPNRRPRAAGADRVSPPMPAAFSMTMLTSTGAGDAYTLSELTAMYNDAGFSDVSAHPIPMSPQTIVLGSAA